MPCREDAKHPLCEGLEQRAGLAGSQDILFLLAWQLIAVQKACQSPHAPARCRWGFLIDVPPSRPWRVPFCVHLRFQDAGRDAPPTTDGSSRK